MLASLATGTANLKQLPARPLNQNKGEWGQKPGRADYRGLLGQDNVAYLSPVEEGAGGGRSAMATWWGWCGCRRRDWSWC